MHVYSHHVRYHEVDQQGFLFNGRYLEICDVAFAEFIRTLGWTYGELNELGADPSVVSVNAQFAVPARYDDLLDVDVQCVRVGTSSFELRNVISRKSELIAELTMVHVNVDAKEEKSVPLPEKVATALRAALRSEKDPNGKQ
ncbi:acyl-CoA thioesterase [Leucobacter denitrificans]|uniref:Acyl-CoA thioesterase n=1 Tax=Leucobacter denitrificans TaxID=683042 RepID=A0A7G9S2A7_9MICO|nr:thioesterase family protein [Leucobacter denitrificans]QNN61982.1 acyl-CoA thioesterase [Leucobacter denitrificans]